MRRERTAGKERCNMNDDKYTEKGFFRRLCEMFKGLRMPRDTREYKLARIELQRLSAPLTAIVVPTLFVIVLCVVTAVSSRRTELPPVDIADPIVDEPPIEDPPVPEPEEIPLPDEPIEFTVDTPDPAPVTPVAVSHDAAVEAEAPLVVADGAQSEVLDVQRAQWLEVL